MKNLRDLRNQDIPRTYDENDLDAMMLSTPRIYSVFSRFHSILWIVAILAPLCNGTTYYYTGSYQTYTVPPGITKVSVELFGAKGGLGGTAILISTSLSVKSGQRYYVYVGGNGDINGLGGWNGGGNGTGSGTGGGGASDIRTRVDDLSSRIVVAAGSAGGASRSYSGAEMEVALMDIKAPLAVLRILMVGLEVPQRMEGMGAIFPPLILLVGLDPWPWEGMAPVDSIAAEVAEVSFLNFIS